VTGAFFTTEQALLEVATGREIRQQDAPAEVALDEAAQNILGKHIRDSTRRVYDSCWKRWELYAKRLGISPTNPGCNAVCNFLTYLKNDKQFAYNTLITYKAALIQRFHTAYPAEQVATIRKLFRGFKNLSPPTARYSTTWNLDVVLAYVEALGENCKLSFRDLSQKLVFLLASISIARVSELAGLSYIPQGKLANAWLMRRLVWKKNTSAGTKAKPVMVVPFFEANPVLCPVLCLQEYLARTGPWRAADREELFLSVQTPHFIVSKDTIARWLKQMLSRAGIDTAIFKAHSIRSAVVAKGLQRGASMDQIMRTADWSSKHNFIRYYKREVSVESSAMFLQ
jgi:hypothetical protein